MGMAGHAEIVRSDRSVFAHIHPDGSVAMAALELRLSGILSTRTGEAATDLRHEMDMRMDPRSRRSVVSLWISQGRASTGSLSR